MNGLIFRYLSVHGRRVLEEFSFVNVKSVTDSYPSFASISYPDTIENNLQVNLAYRTDNSSTNPTRGIQS